MNTSAPKVLKRDVLELLNSSLILDGLHGTIDVADASRGSSSDTLLAVKYNHHLLTFRYGKAESSFDITDADFNMFEADVVPGPWFLPKSQLVAVRKMRSFQTYRLVDGKWKEYVNYKNAQDCESILLGKFNDKNALLEAVMQVETEWRFMSYKDSVWTNKSVRFPSEWTMPGSDVQVITDFDAAYDMFLLKSDDGLRIYNVNAAQQIECIVKCDNVKISKDSDFERIVFAKFSDAKYKDLLHFSTFGLNVFRFENQNGSYKPLFYSSKFSKLNNWNMDYVNSVTAYDVDGDGTEELLGTGPSGLQVWKGAEDDDNEFYLKDVVLKSADNVQRFMTLKTVIPNMENGLLNVVLYDESNVFLVNGRSDTDTIVLFPEEEPKEKIQSQLSLVAPAAYYQRWLHEQLDLSDLLQPVNSLTGKVELSIPLVQLDNPFGVSVHKVFQYRDIPGDRFLARGWSLPLDYITVDRRGSILEENFRYSIIKQSIQMALIQNFELSTNEVISFEVQKELEIKYFKIHERWEMRIKGEAMRYIFGKYNSSEALQYMKEDIDKKLPVAWYLLREEDSSNSFVQYDYKINGDNVHLTNITTDLGSSATFHYDKEQLNNVTVLTQSYKQVIDLVYAKAESKVFLTRIKQDNHAFFEFEYDHQSERMETIVYPNGLKSTLAYESLETNRNDRQEFELIDEDFSIHYGPDYSIILQTDPSKTYALLAVRDLLGGQSTFKNFNDTITTQDPLISHQVLTLENLFGIVVSVKTKRITKLYQFKNKEWNHTTYYLSLDAVVTVNRNSLFIMDGGVLKTIELNDEGTLVVQQQNVPKNVIIYATDRGILMYDDKELHLRYSTQNEHFRWKYEVPGLIQLMSDTLDRFQLEDETRANLFRLLKLDMLQFYNSCIILRTLEITESGTLVVRLKINRLDNEHQLLQDDNWRIYLSRLEDMSLEAKSAAGDSCIIRYVLKRNKYAAEIKSCEGPTITELESYFEKEFQNIQSSGLGVDKIVETAKLILNYSNRRGEFEAKILKDNPFVFNVFLLGVSTDRSGIRTGGKIVSFNGTNWNQQNQENSIDMTLRDKLKLRKFTAADDTYKIVDGDKVLFDSQTSDTSSVKLVWPHYFISQAVGGPPRIYLFDRNETVQLEEHEKLSASSNNLVVITSDRRNATIRLRSISSLLHLSKDVLSNLTLQLSMSETRITTYEHNEMVLDPLSNDYVFTRSKIIPGGNATKFGWYEHRYDPTSREMSRIVSDGDGGYIKHIDPEVDGQYEKPNSTTVLTDNVGRLPIVDLGPMNVTDGEYSYYGFEAYERRLFDGEQRWKFDDQHLVTENGNQLLKLEHENDQFEGILRMKRINETYIFSCWLQTNTVQKIGDEISFITISLVVEENNMAAIEIDRTVVQQIIDDWYYVEKQIKTIDAQKAVTLNVFIAPTEQMTLRVDHVRFSPMNVDFKAYIYRQSFGTVSAVLNNNGLTTQYLLDPHGNRVVFVSESGRVTDFITYSKTYHIRASKTLPHVMEIRPQDGTVERFKDSFSKNWKLSKEGAWEIGSGYLLHKTSEENQLRRTLSTKCDMFVIRFVYNQLEKNAVIQLEVSGSKIDALCKSSRSTCPAGNVADYGEIVVFVSKSHKALWFEGTLMYEASHTIPEINEVRITVAGSVKISEMLILYDPSIKITYYNRLGLPRQTLSMQDEDSVRIREVLYDEIDRSTITTKWTTIKKSSDLLFGFRENYITSVNAFKLEGLVNQLNPDCEGYPYFRKYYANNPTTVEAVISMPGKTFSKDRKYFRQLSRRSNIEILDVLFPPAAGFTQQVETRQNISCHVIINNTKNQKVAYYIQIDDIDKRMTTYEYDGDNLVLELPPMYHVLAGTFNRTEEFGYADKTAKDKQLELQWGNRYIYNNRGQMITKRTPDSGTQRFVYDGDVVRFMVHSDVNMTDKTVLFSYGSTGKIIKEAVLDQPLEFPSLSDNSTVAPESSNYVEYYHGEFDPSPNIRHRSQQSIRRIQDKQMMESLVFDNNDRITKKVHVVPALNTSYSIDYEYLNDKLIMIRYPIDVNGSDFKLKYSYNNAGDMVQIGTLTNPVRFAELQYNADGLVQEIHFEPGSSSAYTREFEYNEPGYLKGITDNFLEEKVSYLEDDGYGSIYSMIFEGLISKTSFTARWHQRSNPILSRLDLRKIENINKPQAEYCLAELLQQGYFDDQLRPLKSFYPALDDTISETCRSKELRKIFHANAFPKEYGHSYEYDSHEQLVKAKYFQSFSEASSKPLTEATFPSKLPEINADTSRKIWSDLIDTGFIVRNCYNPGMCEGGPGNQSLLNNLIPHGSHIQAFFLGAIARMQSISPVSFARKCASWSATTIECSEAWKNLLAHNFVGANSNKTQNALNPTLRTLLRSYSKHVPEIVQVLHQQFATRLGKSPSDVLSCRFDANGNHRLFNRGFARYLFTYKEGTNQIRSVVKADVEGESSNKAYRMEHNSEGSVTVAEHKGIRIIEYDPLLNRPSRIEMVDGRVLKFNYDVRGERTFKQVLDKDGNIRKEKYYIRDLNRNVLVDVQLTFVAKDQLPDVQVTSYVYSNQGLVGFVRNNEFYSVFTDHERSVRLVIKNGEVKAAYDYLPFGMIFRKTEEDLDGSISYLYTGQEWDEETGLYNYHTRLYDPEIGRFYQIDPKSQYPSPYVYAGNSPVTLIDPDGQFFMLLVAIALAIVGAYLGAAAANGAWNPAEWDWRSTNTWLGIFSGALSGAALPYSMASTLTYLTTTLGFSVSTSVSIMVGSGIGFSYFSMAAANSDWNPSEWDMQSPVTWNAFFKGISTSVSVLDTPHTLVSSYNGISTYVGKGLFIGGKIVLTTGFAYMFGVIQQDGEFDPSKWDFSKPGLYLSMFDGAMQATATVTFVTNLPKNAKKWGEKILSALDRIEEIDAFLKYNRHVGADWSKKLADARYFLQANSENFNAIGKMSFNLFLYTTVSSLRLSRSIEKDAVPEFGITMNFIKGAMKTVSFTDKFVNQLVPNTATLSKLADIAEDTEYGALSSSASKLFSSILDFLHLRPINLEPGTTSETSSELGRFSPKKPSSGTLFSIPNCYQLYDAESSNSFIHCYGYSSKIMIHFENQQAGITKDVYRSCYPLSHHNIPSVSCEGEKSSLLFTAYDQSKMFDFLDGWILLVRVMPTAVSRIINSIRSVFGYDTQRNRMVQEGELEVLAAGLKRFDTFKDATNTLPWAEKAIEELNEDIAEFFDEPGWDYRTYAALMERVIALQEDISEDVELYRSTVGGPLMHCGPKQALNILRLPSAHCSTNTIDLLAQDGGRLLQ